MIDLVQVVSVSSDRVVSAAYNENSGRGAVYVFEYIAGTWSQDQKLVASDGGTNDNLGIFVSVSGDQLVAGAQADDDIAINSGATYLFSIQWKFLGRDSKI